MTQAQTVCLLVGLVFTGILHWYVTDPYRRAPNKWVVSLLLVAPVLLLAPVLIVVARVIFTSWLVAVRAI